MILLPRHLLLAAGVACAAHPLAAAEIEAIWLGGPGNYNAPENWNINAVPANGPTDTYRVIVNSGEITLNRSVTVNSFTLSSAEMNVTGGTRTITAATTIGDAFTLVGGVLGLAGAAQLAADADDVYFSLNGGAEISNGATFTHTATGDGETAIVLNADESANGATFRNTATGTFVANAFGNDASLGYGAANANNRFINAGTFNKTGTHDYSANVAFQNSGTVSVQQGALHLNAGDGGSTTGTFAVSSGATLASGGDQHFAAGSGVSGAGAFRVKSGLADFAAGSTLSTGALSIQSGIVTLHVGSTLGNVALTMTGGTLQLDIDHSFTGGTLAGGTVSGSGKTTFAGTTTLDSGNMVFGGSGVKEFNGTTALTTGSTSQYLNINGGTEVRNSGTFTQTRNGAGENVLVLNADSAGGASVFRNTSTGTFTANTAAGDASVGYAAASAGNAFINEGAFVKTGAGSYAFNVAFNNAGNAAVQQGTLDVNAGGAATGSFALSAGSTLGLNGTTTFQSGASVTGAGTVKTNGGAATFQSGSAFSAANLQVAGGTIAFRAGSTLGNTALSVSGGTIELDITHAFTNAAFTNGGGVSGSGHATFAGTTTFDQSTYVFGGSGVKEFSGTVSLETVFNDQFFNVNGGTTVLNTGAFTQTRTGNKQSAIVLNADSAGGDSIFRNGAGATFTAAMNGGAGSVGTATAGAGNQFINEGTFRKIGWSDYNVYVAFTNSGAASVREGLLSFDGGGLSTGAFGMESNGTIAVNNGFSFGNGATVSGDGTFQSNGGATTFLAGSAFAAAKLKVVGGTIAFRAGSTLGATALTLFGGTLEMDINHTFSGAALSSGATIAGAGVTTFDGNHSFNGLSFTIAGTGAKRFAGTTTFASGGVDSYLNVSGGATVVNTNQFTQSKTGAGANVIVLGSDGAGGATLRNTGTFTANVSTGTAAIGQGVGSAGNQVVNEGTFRKSGAGTYNVNAAFLNPGSVQAQEGLLSLDGGGSGAGAFSVDGSGTLAVNGGFSFQNGATVSGAGVFQSNGGTTAFLAGSSFTGAQLRVLSGTTAFRAGSTLGNASLTLAGGTLEMDVDHTFSGATLSSGATLAGSGVTTLAGNYAFNGTSFSVAGSGVKRFTDSVTFGAAAADAYLNLAGGSELVNAGSFTQSKTGAGANAIVLAANGSGAATFRNLGTFTASVGAGTAQMGYGGTFNASNRFINAGTFTKAGAGVYQINVPVDNAGTLAVSQGTLSITAAVTNKAGTITTASGTTLDLSENVHATTTGTLVHNGSTLALGANDVIVAKDYQNAAFGSGNAFNAHANVTGSGKILADTGTTVAYGGDATGTTLSFGVLHVGESAVTKTYSVRNTGAAGVAVRGAIQTTVGGASVTDSRLSGTGLTTADLGKLDADAGTAGRSVTFTPTTVGALSGQQLHVTTNFDNVMLGNLQIQGSVNHYAEAAWTNATGATLTKLSGTNYTLSFGTISLPSGTLTAELDLLNVLRDAIYQDTLGGTFDLGGVTHFGLGGFDAFAGLASGATDGDFSITLNPAAAGNGTFRDTLVFHPTSSNASGTWSLGSIQLTIEATVVPEPGTIALLSLGGLALLGTRRFRRPTA